MVNVHGLCKANKYGTAMDATWTTLNRGTSMVQTVLYSGCTEVAVPCSLYWTCIQYGSDAPTARISKHQIHHGEITNSKTTINKKDKTTMLKLTRNKREQDSGRQEAERERKEHKEA